MRLTKTNPFPDRQGHRASGEGYRFVASSYQSGPGHVKDFCPRVITPQNTANTPVAGSTES